MIVLIAVIDIWKRNIFSPLKCWEGISPTGEPELAGEDEDSIVRLIIANPELIFKYHILRQITSSFEAENKLGNGGFESVFKGVLSNGREVAAKLLFMGPRQAYAEYLNDANLISRVQHKNLVKLLDCSVKSSRRLLVYEYLQNSNIDEIVFDATKRHLLKWKERYDIRLELQVVWPIFTGNLIFGSSTETLKQAIFY